MLASIECCPLTVCVPDFCVSVLPTTHIEPTSSATPIALSVWLTSPPRLIASVIESFNPLDLAEVVITPKMCEVPARSISCVKPTMSSRVADVLL